MPIKIENRSCPNGQWVWMTVCQSSWSVEPTAGSSPDDFTVALYSYFETESLVEKLIPSLLPGLEESGLVVRGGGKKISPSC